MATEAHNFLHVKEASDGQKLEVTEEGADNWNIRTSTKFQKYAGKKEPFRYIGYNHLVDMKNDEFLNSLGKEEKKEFDVQFKKIWCAKAKHKEDQWYMIQEGQQGKKVALYQDYWVFKAVRDAPLPVNWSWKGCWFADLASAKNYIQMARDEEGVCYQWPHEIPVIWKKGPLTKNDITNFPGWVVVGEEAEIGDEEDEEAEEIS